MTRVIRDDEVRQLAAAFERCEPQELLAWAIDRFGSRLALSTSFQADGLVILDMAWHIDPEIHVFTVDTGRLPQETYDLIERVRERYQIPIAVYYPEPAELEGFVRAEGINAFYRSADLRLQCCDIRKADPLRRALQGYEAWISGQRRDHVATRATIGKIERDWRHGEIVKLNPLAAWTEAEVWSYIRGHDIPYNALYDRGYTSIGCAPCTRAIKPGEETRAGRWWWEQDVPKECGIHRRDLSYRQATQGQ